MTRLKYQNHSDDCIEIVFLEKNTIEILEPNSTFDLLTEQNSISFIIKEHVYNNSSLYQIFEIVIAFLVSIPLWFINYFNIESIDKSLRFPTKFQIVNLKNDVAYNVYVNNSSEKYHAFCLKVNNEFMAGKIECSQDELIRQIREYKKSMIISWLFPILIIICLLIISICFANLFLGIITFSIAGLFGFLVLKVYRKNKRIIKRIEQNLMSSQDQSGDGSLIDS